MPAVLLLLGSTVAACWLVNVWHESKEQEAKIVELRKLAAREPVTDMKGRQEPVTEPSTASQSDKESSSEPTLHNFAVLKEKNHDCVAWVSIPGTSIDFPVMQNGDFYLKHDFDGNYTDYGLPFLDERCSLDTSDNLIIYGHHMNDGSMFSELLNYVDKSYCEAHPEIILETEDGAEIYQIAAVLRAAGNLSTCEYSQRNGRLAVIAVRQ